MWGPTSLLARTNFTLTVSSLLIAGVSILALNYFVIDPIAERAADDGILTYPATDMPDPIGYICFVEDPDGNTIEFSHGQGTYGIIAEEWGS